MFNNNGFVVSQFSKNEILSVARFLYFSTAYRLFLVTEVNLLIIAANPTDNTLKIHNGKGTCIYLKNKISKFRMHATGSTRKTSHLTRH